MLLWYKDRHIAETIIRQFTRFLVVLCIIVCSHSTYIVEAIEVVLKFDSYTCEHMANNQNSSLEKDDDRHNENECVSDISDADIQTGNQSIVDKINSGNSCRNCTRRVNNLKKALIFFCFAFLNSKKIFKKKNVAINEYDRGIVKLWKIIRYIHDRYDTKGTRALFCVQD